MQIYFPKSLNLTPSLFLKKGKSNHKEFNMKILYLYSTQKKYLKINSKQQKTVTLDAFQVHQLCLTVQNPIENS